MCVPLADLDSDNCSGQYHPQGTLSVCQVELILLFALPTNSSVCIGPLSVALSDRLSATPPGAVWTVASCPVLRLLAYGTEDGGVWAAYHVNPPELARNRPPHVQVAGALFTLLPEPLLHLATCSLPRQCLLHGKRPTILLACLTCVIAVVVCCLLVGPAIGQHECCWLVALGLQYCCPFRCPIIIPSPATTTPVFTSLLRNDARMHNRLSFPHALITGSNTMTSNMQMLRHC